MLGVTSGNAAVGVACSVRAWALRGSDTRKGLGLKGNGGVGGGAPNLSRQWGRLPARGEFKGERVGSSSISYGTKQDKLVRTF